MRLLRSVCASAWSAGIFSDVTMSVVSSAYVYTLELGTVWMMSLMYRRKKVVESVLPCGIPSVITRSSDWACCVCVVWMRFRK